MKWKSWKTRKRKPRIHIIADGYEHEITAVACRIEAQRESLELEGEELLPRPFCDSCKITEIRIILQ